MKRATPATERRTSLGTGVLLWATWQVSCFAGYWVGNVIPVAWSLDFVVPLCFLALLVPALEDGPTRIAALAAGIAVVALDAAADAPVAHLRRTHRHRRGNACRIATGRAMSSAIEWWVVILVVGALNYLSRLSFIAVFAQFEMPPLVARALRFVPAAMLMAIVVPAVVFSTPGTLAFTYTNPKLVAAAGGGRRRLAHEGRDGDDGHRHAHAVACPVVR